MIPAYWKLKYAWQAGQFGLSADYRSGSQFAGSAIRLLTGALKDLKKGVWGESG